MCVGVSGLFSSLALSSTVATSILMGVQPPPAPDLPEQNGGNHSTLSGDSSTASMGKSKNSKKSNFSTVDTGDMLSDASEILTGNSNTLAETLSPTGVDISSHQHTESSKINIKDIVAGGQQFAFIKATEGTGYINPHFRSDVISFINEKTPVGFYHYAKPSGNLEDARSQAQHFVKTTGIDKGVKSFPPVLDIEENEAGATSDELVAWTHAFVDEVKELSGQDVMIYTYPTFWRTDMGNSTEFNHLPLWIADYNNSSAPTMPLPGGWDDWVFWQYTSEGMVDGSPRGIDVNFYNGSTKGLKKLYDKSSSPQKTSGRSGSQSSSGVTIVTKTVTKAPEAPELSR